LKNRNAAMASLIASSPQHREAEIIPQFLRHDVAIKLVHGARPIAATAD